MALRGFFGTLLIASAPLHAAGHSHPDFAAELAQELLGSHVELFRGRRFSHFEWTSKNNDLEFPDGRPTVLAKVDIAGEIPTINLTIPCIKFPPAGYEWITFGHTLVDMIEPCGAMELPPKGIDFNTTFGRYHLPGANLLDDELKRADNAFSAYTGYVVGAGVVLYVISQLMSAEKVAAIKATLKKIKNGGDLPGDEDDHLASTEENAAAAKAKLDPKSDQFVCPGNIYRVVSVMHPGIVGYSTWMGYCFKAGICAYMQFYLPYNILTHCLKKWQFNGAKSPFYFAMNLMTFATQFAALGNVCALFASKCTQVIKVDAAAVYYLVTHDEPPEGQQLGPSADEMESQSPSLDTTKTAPLLQEASSGKAGAKDAANAVKGAVKADIKKLTKPPQWLLRWNQNIWCTLNLLLTCFSAIMLQICMFMKVATFTGDIMNISLVAVSLYFVFELDDKVMESDPKLRPRFRREVIKQTVELDAARWKGFRRLATFTMTVVNMCVPFGLLMIATVSWRQVMEIHAGEKPIVIGGDPFSA